MRPDLMDQLTAFLHRFDLAEQTLAEHRCTDSGKCTCSTPTVLREWPCTAYSAAAQVVEWAPRRVR